MHPTTCDGSTIIKIKWRVNMNGYQNSAYLKAVKRAKRAERLNWVYTIALAVVGLGAIWLMVVIYTV